MDIEEAKIKSKITQEERDAVGNYINSGHTQMNALIDFDVQEYLKASEKGWYLVGINDSEKTSERIGKEVLDSINQIANIFSAMRKYMLEQPCPQRVMRGTSVKEANSLIKGKSYDRIISTTSNEITAKSFGDAFDPAFLRIALGNDIPFIDITDFIGKDNLNRYEYEYIFSPFTKVKSSIFRSNYHGYKYYDIELEKPELREFNEGEKEEFAENIKANFSKIISIGKEYRGLLSEEESLDSARIGTTDREELKYIRQRKDEIFDRTNIIFHEQKEFSKMIKNYIQGLCAEKEKEFLEARKTVEKDRARVFARQREERLENERKSGISYIKEQVPITLERASNLPEAIYAEYLELRKKEATYNEFAKKLGIRFNLSINNASIQESIRQIKQNITVMKQKIAELKITDQIQLTDLNDAISTNDKYAKALDSSYSKNSKLKDIVKDYREECILATKKGIDEKAQDMIKRIRLELLRNKKLEIESRKISWFGKIRGLDKLKSAELENVDLEMILLQNSPLVQKSNYSIHDILSDIQAFSITELGGNMPPEMLEFQKAIREVFGVNERAIKEAVMRKTQSHPISVENINKREKTSAKIDRISNKNKELRNDIARINYPNTIRLSGEYYIDEKSPQNDFSKTLEKIASLIDFPEFNEREEKAEETTKSEVETR